MNCFPIIYSFCGASCGLSNGSESNNNGESAKSLSKTFSRETHIAFGNRSLNLFIAYFLLFIQPRVFLCEISYPYFYHFSF